MCRLPGLDHWRGLLALCLLLLGLQQTLAAAVIQAKAWLAPALIERAWEQTIAEGGRPVRPWPWADTWPVARLIAPEAGVDLMVLAGDSGNALAFGPGLASYSSTPGEGGVSVLAGHRDTHFAFLEHARVGDVLEVESISGRVQRYQVEHAGIVDASREGIFIAGLAPSLLLVTCYPFDTLRVGGPLRYVVRAVPQRL
jgi:sortase A